MRVLHWLRPRNFSRSERNWIAGYFAAVAVFSTLPYCIFAWFTPPDQQYAWASVFYYDDYFQYYAWARRIARGDWLIRNYFTENPAASFALINPYFICLGWLTRLVGNVYFASHLLRVVALAPFAWISYAFLALFQRDIRLRRLAHVLMLGGGLEYPFFLLFRSRNPTSLADPYVFKILYRYGHLTVELCLVLLIFGIAFAAWRDKQGNDARLSVGEFGCLVFLTLLLGLINPYYLILVGSVLGAQGYWMIARRGKSLRAVFQVLLPVALGGALASLQYRVQPISSHLGAISFDDPISLGDMLLFFASFVPWLIAEGISSARSRSTATECAASFLWLWIASVVLLVLAPLAFRARMVFGLQIALAILAVKWIGKTKIAAWRHWPIYILLALEFAFTFFVEGTHFWEGIGRVDRAMLAAFEFLDKHARPGDCVLAPARTGNFLPAYCSANTFIGHSFQTENFYAKEKGVTFFFRKANADQRLKFLDLTKMNFVLQSPTERAENPAFRLPGWKEVYSHSGYAIYQRP